jgi:Peptidase MA superfamily
MKSKPLIAALLFLCLAIPCHAAAGREVFNGQGIVIRFEPPLRNAAVSLAGIYPRVKADLEAKTGWNVGFAPLVVLIRENREFRKYADSDLVTAYAVPGRDLIVIDYSKVGKTPFDLQSTLEHELCHLLLHRMAGTDIPRWLDEGVAQWASGGAVDIMNPEEKDILKQAVLSRSLIPLNELDVFPEQPRALILAYQESRSFIEFIEREYGTDRLRAVLHALGNGKPPERAIEETLSTEMGALEEKWEASMARRYSWPMYIADHLYWVLFFAAGVVTLVGYLKFRRRLKNYRDEEGDEEKEEEGDGEDRE